MTLDELWAVFAASLLHSLLPGPAMIVTATRTAQFGLWQGCLSVAGILCARVLVGSVAVALLAGVLALPPQAIGVLKWLSAALLLLIAARLCQARPMSFAPQSGEAKSWQSFLEAALMGLANPMTLVFCVALLPQVLPVHHVTPAGGALAVVALVAGAACAQAAAVLIGLGAMGSVAAGGTLLQRLVGVGLAGLALSSLAAPINESALLSLTGLQAEEVYRD